MQPVPTPGQRIRLEHTSDPHTHLQPGAEGEFLMRDGAGTIHVQWDDGSHLGLIPGEDRWTVIPAAEPEPAAPE